MATKTKEETGTDLAEAKRSEMLMLSDDDFFDIPTGLEDVDAADVSLPRYTILQGLSPQVNPRKDEYIEGAKMGMILNTATGQVTDSVRLVMAAYERRNIEWVPRDKPCPLADFPKVTGGGLYRDYGTDDAILEECRRYEENNSLWTPRGHELVVTGTWYVINPETLSTAFIAMGKTQFTSSKKLMAGIRDEKIFVRGQLRPAPLFYRVWELGTTIRQNGDNEWFVWAHKPAEPISTNANGVAILNVVKEITRTLSEGAITIDVAMGESDAEVGAVNADHRRM